MTTYVRLPQGKLWHLVGRRWQHDTFTVCDRRIPDGVPSTAHEPAQEDTCWNCLTETTWEDREQAATRQTPDPEPAMTLGELYRALNDAGATLHVETQRITCKRRIQSAHTPEELDAAVRHYWPVIRHQWRGCLDEGHTPYWAATPDPLRPPSVRFLCTRCHRDVATLRLVPLSSIGGDGTNALPYRPLPLPPGLPPLGAPVEIRDDEDADDEEGVA